MGRIVLGRAAPISAAGIGLGLTAALGTNRFVATMLYEVMPSDGLTLLASGVMLLAATAIASLVPAVASVKSILSPR